VTEEVFVEAGSKRVFAGAIEWPGWCRGAKTDRAVAAAEGRALAKGPRGGGRDVDAIVAHVAEAEGSYLSALGGPRPPKDGDRRPTIRRVLRARARGEPPERVPRSGKLWTPRYFIRRTAWHALDPPWEIEDRLQPKA
jgi:hypothetical protein